VAITKLPHHVANDSVGPDLIHGESLTIDGTGLVPFQPISDARVAKAMSIATARMQQETKKVRGFEQERSRGMLSPLDRIAHNYDK
jgi:hypothetical protein